MEKLECHPELMNMVLTMLLNAPNGQIDEEIKNEIAYFRAESYGEMYDFIVNISKKDITKISSFVRELCALDKHYLRPSN